MNKRPRSIKVVSWIFVAAGVVGLAYHAGKSKARRPIDYDFLWTCLPGTS